MFNEFHVNIFRYASSPTNSKVLRFKDKLKTGKYTLEAFVCTICGNESEWTTVARSPEGFVWSFCMKCGLFQLNKRLCSASLKSFYESGEYQLICMGGLDDKRHFLLEYKVMSLYFLDILNKLGVKLQETSILEIGCGSGGILLAFKEAGATVKGFDIDEHKVNYGKKHVPEIYIGDAMNRDTCPSFSPFNIILISNVLEHLQYPRDFLKRIFDKVESAETKVIIDVPNFEGSSLYSDKFTDFLHIAHLWYFTSLSLERLINSAGGSVTHIFNRGAAMSVVCSKNNACDNNNNSALLTASIVQHAFLKCEPNSVANLAKKYAEDVLNRKMTFLGKIKCGLKLCYHRLFR